MEKNILSPVALSLRSEERVGGGKGLFFLNVDLTAREPGHYARRQTAPRAQKVVCSAAHKPEPLSLPGPWPLPSIGGTPGVMQGHGWPGRLGKFSGWVAGVLHLFLFLNIFAQRLQPRRWRLCPHFQTADQGVSVHLLRTVPALSHVGMGHCNRLQQTPLQRKLWRSLRPVH